MRSHERDLNPRSYKLSFHSTRTSVQNIINETKHDYEVHLEKCLNI